RPVAAPLLAMQNLLQDVLLEQVQLWLVAEEAGLIDREVFEQGAQLLLAFVARKEVVIGIETLESRGAQTGLQPVLEEVDAPLVKVHAALLVNQGLQQFQFGIGDCDGYR